MTSKRTVPPTSRNLPKKFKHYRLGSGHGDTYFTRREADIMLLLLRGETYQAIAKQFELSKRTVEFYVTNMKMKLKCRYKRELVRCVSKSEFVSLYYESERARVMEMQAQLADA